MNRVMLLVLFIISVILLPESVASQWYAGKWDTRLWYSDYHPLTVVIRLEAIDVHTLLPIKDAQVTLEGEYIEEHVERGQVTRKQMKHWESSAFTEERGVAIISLLWQKDYPWSVGPPRIQTDFGWRYADSWITPLDDVEKVRTLLVRHPRYRGFNRSFDFNHILQVGQREGSTGQTTEVCKRFNRTWLKEIERPDVHLCVLNVDGQISSQEQHTSTGIELFEAVRLKDCGNTFEPYVGPYLLYNIRVELQPIRRR